MKHNGHLTIPEEVASRLQDRILIEKAYQPGDRIPNEEQLAAMFGVGRNSIREAVKILVNSGLLQVQRGRGTFVRRRAEAPDSFASLLRSSDDLLLLKDWMQVRLALEPLAVRSAIANGTQEQLDEIMRWALVCEDNQGDDAALAEADTCFHVSIARASGNCVINNLLPAMEAAIADILDVNIYTFAYKNDRALLGFTIQEHTAIAEQIRAGNAEAAVNLMVGHLQRVSLCLNEGADLLRQHEP